MLMGFSVEACQVAMLVAQWNTPGLAERLGVSFEGVKPNGTVLDYDFWNNTNTVLQILSFGLR